MYSLFMGLWTMLFSKVQYQILILGLDDAGKTTFLEQLKHLYAGNSPPDELKIPPTVGLNIGKLDVSRCRFLFWDLGGQASLRVLWDKYYSDAHAVLWVVDASDPARLSEVAQEIARVAQDKDLREAPIVVLANKQDAPGALGANELALALGLPPGCGMSAPALAVGATGMKARGGSLVPSGSSLAAAAAAPPAAAASTAAAPAASTSSAASSSSSSSSSSVSPPLPLPSPSAAAAFDDHVVRVMPISALSGQGVAAAIDLLMELVPRARRTQILQEREIR